MQSFKLIPSVLATHSSIHKARSVGRVPSPGATDCFHPRHEAPTIPHSAFRIPHSSFTSRFSQRSHALLTIFLSLLLSSATALAQSPVTLTINTRAPGYVVPTNFVGLSMGVETEQADHRGVAGNIFSAADTQLVTLFQNIGLHSLRLGGGATLSNSDIDALFTFQSALTNLQVIYQLPFDTIADSVPTAQYIWTNYHSQFYAFSLDNEPDKKTNLTYASWFQQWTNFAEAITSAVPGAVFEGPDPAGQTWGAQFASDLKGSSLLALITLHWYVGGNPTKDNPNSTPQQQIDNMLSSSWVTSLYPSTYNNALVPAQADGFPLRFTEADDCVGGVTNASNAFAGALWALDFLHWWAAHGAAGVNFQNTEWIPTDTFFPDANTNYEVAPKAYGIKAFNTGNTGSEEPVLVSNPNTLDLTAYAIGQGTNLYVTIINKEHDTGARDASVTITANGFLSGSVAAMYLIQSNGDVGATNDVTFGGGIITNNAPWQGQWTPLNPLAGGQCTVTVPAASGVVVKIQAAAQIQPVLAESWTSSSDSFTNADWNPALAGLTPYPDNNDGTGYSYNVVITNGGTCYYGGVSGDPVWTNTIGQLWLGGLADGVGGGMSNTFFMTGGGLTLEDAGSSDFSIGGNMPGIGLIPCTNFFTMTGGTLNVMASSGTNWIAAAPASVTMVNFDGGTANLITLGIGGRGNATVNIAGGNVNVGSGIGFICGIGLGVGVGEGAGTLNMISGTLTATNRSGRAVILGNNCGKNVLNVSGGTLNASGIQFGFGTSSALVTNTFIVSGGTLNISGAGIGRNGAKDINSAIFSGGTFSTLATPLNTTASWDWSGLVPITLTNSPGPGIVNLEPASGTSIEFDPVLSGNGGLDIAGPGLVLLTAAENFTGPTTVAGGVLQLAGGSSLTSHTISTAAGGTLDASALAAFNLNAGQTLSGNGTIVGPTAGNISLNSGATLAASSSGSGTFTISNNLVFNAGSTNYVVVNKTGSAIANSEVVGLTSVTLGGTLVIANIGVTPLTSGDAIPLFSAASYHTNGFGPANIIPVTPGNGLQWDTSTLGSDGTLRVASILGVNTNPTNIIISLASNQLTLNWPADHTGWQLQAQTNSLASGLGTNWVDVTGTGASNRFALPLNLTNGTVFYRLIYR